MLSKTDGSPWRRAKSRHIVFFLVSWLRIMAEKPAILTDIYHGGQPKNRHYIPPWWIFNNSGKKEEQYHLNRQYTHISQKHTRQDYGWKHQIPSIAFPPQVIYPHYFSFCNSCRTPVIGQCPDFYLWFQLPF